MIELAGKRVFFWMFVCVLSSLLGHARSAQAEPWLSTRFAQNCAGCHAPGRKNLEPSDRRCSLSCQGCHVNPNGGGLRSYYGKWNEDRWLRSFAPEALAQRPAVAPASKQKYSRKNKHETPPRDGFPLVESDNTTVNEKHFTRADGYEKEVSRDEDEFMYQVPEGDPLREMLLNKVDGGGDVRYESDYYQSNNNKYKYDHFLMDADFGLEWRPFYRHLHVVYESRFEGSPVAGTHIEDVMSRSYTRSLYAMVDDLPFNTFVMAGAYRPLFGNFVPDHYTLAQEMTSYGISGDTKNYNLLYEAVTIGTAPNVPYLNVHAILKQLNPLNPGLTDAYADKTNGVAVNAGMRFVTLGASLNYYFWSTTDQLPDRTIKTQMHSFDVAAKLGRVVTNLEALSMQRDDDSQDYRQGGVVTLDTQTQLWRENYWTTMLAESNTETDGLPGRARQVKAGIRSFLLAGTDVSVVYEYRFDEDDKDVIKTQMHAIESQVHLFF